MIDDPRATDMVTGFADQWLQLDKLDDSEKDVTVYKTWKPELLALFRQETEAFVQSVWKTDAKLTTLLTAPYTMVNGPLAQFFHTANNQYFTVFSLPDRNGSAPIAVPADIPVADTVQPLTEGAVTNISRYPVDLLIVLKQFFLKFWYFYHPTGDGTED